jgi:hypothetical protein
VKKKHWTQTPEGKKRQSERMARWHAEQGHNGHGKRSRRRKPQQTRETNATSTTPDIDEAIFAYALGYIESWISTYAASAGVPANALASRVGKVLHSKTRG